MDKQERKTRLLECIPHALDALNELKEISIAYNADFEGEGTFVRLDNKRFDKFVDGISALILDLSLNVVDKEI